MPCVLPSEVVKVIDSMFPRLVDGQREYGILDSGHLASMATLLGLVEQVPEELLIVSGGTYTSFLAAISAIRAAVQRWQSGQSYMLAQITGFQGHVLALIRSAMEVCPDDFPAAGTAELAFIDDSDLRDGLRLDTSAVNRALSNGEWKAATVLAGSVVEALLLWALHQESLAAAAVTKAQELFEKSVLDRKPNPSLEKWYLPEYVEVAFALNVIKEDTANQARLAKDYRNLIHPGRSQRLGKRCDRGTALGAVAAIEMVVRDLTGWKH